MRSTCACAASLLYLLPSLGNAQFLVPANEPCPALTEVVNTIYEIDPIYYNTYIDAPTSFIIFEDITIAPESLPTNITIVTSITATGYQTITLDFGPGGALITPSGVLPPTSFPSTTAPLGAVPSAAAIVVGTLATGRLGGYFSATSAILPGGISETVPGLTLENCVDFCADYDFFAVSNGDVCMCGDTLASTAIPQPASSCNTACAGDSAQACGSDICIEIYSVSRDSAAGTSSTSSTLSPITSNPGDMTSVNGGSTQVFGGTTSVVGGSTEVYGGSTSVAGGSTQVIGGMSSVVDGSTSFISGSNSLTSSPSSSSSPLFSSPLSTSSSSASGSSSGPNVDSSTSSTGGTTPSTTGTTQSDSSTAPSTVASASAIATVMADGATATLAGGFAAPSGVNLITGGQVQALPSLTLEACAELCSSFTYFGVSDGDICTCGNTVSNAATPQDASTCDVPCSGNSSEACGSTTCTQVYVNVGRNGLTTTPGTSSSSSGNGVYGSTTPPMTTPSLNPTTTFVTTTTASPPANLYPPAIILQTYGRGLGREEKRQDSGGFISSNGTSTGCSGGTSYVLDNGLLYADGALVSTNVGVDHALFGPITPVGTITGNFSIDGDGNLVWSNGNFTDGAASYCIDPDGFLNVIFNANDPTADCNPTQIRAFAGSACPGFQPVYPSLLYETGPAGPTGPAGATGLQGAQGPQGLQGVSGESGASGQPGATGPDGAQGAQGLAGPTGASGLSGQVGATGPQGAVGQQGPAGDAGPTGASGLSGLVGATGLPGAVGQQGPIGESGLSGPVGATGPTGVPGLSGEVGATGISGLSGQVGATGPTGVPGSSGEVGATGVSGLSGQIGPQGPTGVSGLSGQIGATGPTGVSGLSGQVGPQGPTGVSGLSGQVGSQGPTGVSGISGQAGPTGVQGPPGSGIGSSGYQFVGCHQYAQGNGDNGDLGFRGTVNDLNECAAICGTDQYMMVGLGGTVTTYTPGNPIAVLCVCATKLENLASSNTVGASDYTGECNVPCPVQPLVGVAEMCGGPNSFYSVFELE